MKKTLLFIFSICCGVFSAQNLTLTQSANEPAIGDKSETYPLDTTFYTTGLPNNITGTGVTWDFSNLAVTPTLLTSNYVDPSTLTVTVPAGATYAQSQNGSYNFFKSTTTPTTQTEILAIKIGTLGLNFTNSGIVARYPIDYGYALGDAIAGTVDFSVTANFNGNVITTADGEGTLLMPQGNTFTNVLRVKSVQTITVTVFTFIQIANIQQTVYNYYHSSSKFPILSINQSKTTFSTQTTDITTANGNADFLVIGLNEHEINNQFFSVYPNPAENNVSIKTNNGVLPESIRVFNMLGKEILMSKNTNQLNVSALPRGTYFIEVRTKNLTGRKALVLTK